MSREISTSSSRVVPWIAGIVAVGVFVTAVPLFRIVPLKAARQHTADAAFNAPAFVESFWTGPLHLATASAIDATELLAALKTDPQAAATRLGHRLGLSGHTSYFVRGRGEITSIADDTIVIALPEGGSAVIEIGPVFGNAIRDGSGLLNVSDFPNAQDFNALSAAINQRVEADVFPALQTQAAVGRTVQFAGGVEIPDSAVDSTSLTVVPVVIDFL